jgi:hypothetical protein
MLATALTPDLAAFLRNPPTNNGSYRTPAELDLVLDAWAQRGAQLVELGRSKNGRSIRAAIINPEGARTLVAWGYPHPDEPLGAEALVWLGEAALAKALPDLSSWRLVLILCADPDEASRQRWFSEDTRTAEAFCAGAWRPTKLDWMVDYGFPLHWGPFYQPPDYEGSCRTHSECKHGCASGDCALAPRPHAPLPESLALATAIDRYRPHVVASMHNTHSGGDYTFLLEREPRAILEALVALPGEFGLTRHLGESIDRGRRWLRDAPDLVHEPSLEDFRRDLARMPGFDEELVYQRNHSAAAYLQAKGWGAQFICPETTQFRHRDFGDISEINETVDTLVSVEQGRNGRYYEKVRIACDGVWVVAQQQPTSEHALRARGAQQLPLTRGMLGVMALAQRRHALATADSVWKQLQTVDDLVYHPYMEERRLLRVPGAYVHDRSQLIFRTRNDYARAPTRAQAASFRWLWPLHTATLLGNFQNFLGVQTSSSPVLARARVAVSALQTQELDHIPASMRAEGERGVALASALARVFLLMRAHS